MLLFLIKPKIITRNPKVKFDILQPLALAVLAAVTPPDVEIKVYDERLEKIPFDQKPDLVGITIDSTTVKSGYKIATEFRKKNILVVLGGLHATVLPEEAIQYCDSVVIGNAEKLWPHVINDMKKGQLKKYYQNPKNNKKIQIIPPDRSVFKGKKYDRCFPVEFSRGCAHHCSFCSIPVYYNNTLTFRPINDVFEEIKALGEGSTILFTDDNIIANPELSKDLFLRLIPLKIKWIGEATVKTFLDEELMDLMAQSGCLLLLIGFESRKKQNLSQMEKQHNIDNFNCEDGIKKLQSKGIAVHGSFVFGFNNDDEISFDEAVSFAIKNKFFKCYFNCIYPYPGTKFYNRLLEENRFIYPKWWINDNYYLGDVSFHPSPPLKAESLEDLCKISRKRFYSAASILKRFNTKAHYKNIRRIAQYFFLNFTHQRK